MNILPLLSTTKDKLLVINLLTRHLQTVLEDGDEVGVGISVAQLLLDHLKHGTSTLSIYMGLLIKRTTLELLLCLTTALLEFGYFKQCIQESTGTDISLTLLTISNLLASSESSSFRTISKKSKCLDRKNQQYEINKFTVPQIN